MTDFTSLQSKVNDLKAKVEQNSITPIYLGSVLDDFIQVLLPFADYSDVIADLRTIKLKISALSPVRCDDEADMQAKAATAKVGQQFYIPEND